MVLYTGFNGKVNKKLMVNYTTITCLCYLCAAENNCPLKDSALMVLYTGFNGKVNKKLMVYYTTITCLCFHDNYMPPLNVQISHETPTSRLPNSLPQSRQRAPAAFLRTLC